MSNSDQRHDMATHDRTMKASFWAAWRVHQLDWYVWLLAVFLYASGFSALSKGAGNQVMAAIVYAWPLISTFRLASAVFTKKYLPASDKKTTADE
ncbi:MAG: hypothetical protein RIB57_05685 [Pelagibacterium sp.]|jgi:hypothetical protein|uniref:hypothetical protein n=1 Tax=Pelagibacterium sp. TaxID=1967288 RepID=UPI0032EBE4C1|tara:strand:- start:169 stop:453 length:285 start_codon:yes stop_codon:yes gene_type:complete